MLRSAALGVAAASIAAGALFGAYRQGVQQGVRQGEATAIVRLEETKRAAAVAEAMYVGHVRETWEARELGRDLTTAIGILSDDSKTASENVTTEVNRLEDYLLHGQTMR